MAGSMRSCLAAMGSTQPTSLDRITVATRDREITRAMAASWYWRKIRRPLAAARAALTIRDTANSLRTTRITSRGWISSRARPRITSVALWEPQLPPVSISMGRKATSSGTAEMASSYRVMMEPVMVADSIRISSQRMRCRACSQAEAAK